MPMTVLLAAGLFDNPWIVAVLLMVGALVNWLTKRRAEKEARQAEEQEPPAAHDQPEGRLDFEEALRRLMGEEPPAREPAPPPLPPPAHGDRPAPAWQHEAPYPIPGPIAPTSRPPPVPRSPAGFPASAAGETLDQMVRRIEQLQGVARQPSALAGHGLRPRSRAARPRAAQWRDPRSARQAFVASIVFAPPKSLEP